MDDEARMEAETASDRIDSNPKRALASNVRGTDAKRAFAAMMGMTKIEIAAIIAARSG